MNDKPILAAKLLVVRNAMFLRQKELRRERQWLERHNHNIEASVKTKIADEMDIPRCNIEAILDEAGVSYFYAEDAVKTGEGES